MLAIQLGPYARGANLSAISQHAHEREIALPPLTSLHVSAVRAERDALVLEYLGRSPTAVDHRCAA